MLLSEYSEALRQLGSNVRIARKRRRWSIGKLAERMQVSRQTVQRLEKGEEGVSLGVVGLALRAMALPVEPVAAIADPAADKVGLSEELARAPRAKKRIADDTADDYDFGS